MRPQAAGSCPRPRSFDNIRTGQELLLGLDVAIPTLVCLLVSLGIVSPVESFLLCFRSLLVTIKLSNN